MADKVDLSQYDQSTIDAAFWLQEHIRVHGIDAVGFMDVAHRRAVKDGPNDIADGISKEFTTQL